MRVGVHAVSAGPGDAQLGARPLPGVTDVAQSKPETINLPLRTMMLQHVLDILINRLEACTATEKSIEDAQKMAQAAKVLA